MRDGRTIPGRVALAALPLWAALFALLLAGCERDRATPEPPAAAAAAEASAAPRSVEAVADEYLAALLERHPELGTQYSLPGARHDRLTDNSGEARAAWQLREDAWLAELGALGMPVEVGSRDWITYGILYEALAGAAATRICRSELWAASSMTAWYTSVPSLFEIQPVDTPELRTQALDRLADLPRYIDTEIANLRRGLELGFSAPRLTVAPAVAEVRSLAEEGSPFLSPGERADDPAYAAEVRALFEAQVIPAVERFARFLEAEYLPQAREDIGVGFNPDGDACYPALVRYHATIEPPADEIHSLGRQPIAAIRAEMQTIIDEHFPGATIEQFLRSLNEDPRYTFGTEDEVLQYSVSALERARAAMPRAFGRLPRADVEIRPYPAYRQSGTGEYQSSSEDGSRPGIYYIAVTDPTRRSRAIQESVLHHETWPGHHLQGAIALELGDRVHPIARYLWSSGFGEGWALYSERLADELGLYSGPLDRMGLLSDQAARAARLVVDTGLHTLGWTRQQAVDYMLDNTAWPAVDIESEVNRYIAWPGQATAYMLGMLEIRRLRDLAEAELGAAFDLREFHDRVLGSGNINLPMLAASVISWVEGARPVAACRPGDAVPGLSRHVVRSGGLDREYLLYLPPADLGEQTLPLILDLHGSGSNPEQELQISGLAAAADERGYALALPFAVRPLPQGGYTWNVPADPQFPDDIRFLGDLLDQVTAAECIDPNRVYVTGFSGGARLGSAAACQLADRISALAAVGGLRAPEGCAGSVPVLGLHGTADPINPYSGGGREYWKYGIEQAFHAWGRENGCDAQPERERVEPDVERWSLPNCTGNAEVTLYRILGAGHVWPGSTFDLPEERFGPAPDTVDATAILLDFFERHQSSDS